jgi:regulator of replication initiation timing
MKKMTKKELRDLLDEHEERYQVLYEENAELRARDTARKVDIDRLNKLLYLVGKLTFENEELRNRLKGLEKEKNENKID